MGWWRGGERSTSTIVVLVAWQLLTPIVKVLRLMDGNKPAMGKIYDRMCNVGERINNSTVSWKAKAATIHATRWEYLHSHIELRNVNSEAQR